MSVARMAQGFSSAAADWESEPCKGDVPERGVTPLGMRKDVIIK